MLLDRIVVDYVWLRTVEWRVKYPELVLHSSVAQSQTTVERFQETKVYSCLFQLLVGGY